MKLSAAKATTNQPESEKTGADIALFDETGKKIGFLSLSLLGWRDVPVDEFRRRCREAGEAVIEAINRP
jgi:hypothetical protein